jgi:general secretion pathway protein D
MRSLLCLSLLLAALSTASAEQARMMVIGPGAIREGDRVIVEIRVASVHGVAHFPLRIAFDPAILEFEEASPGEFAGSDGSSSLFLAGQDGRGVVKLAISRMPPAAGISGDGMLCRLTFRAAAPGETRIISTGSRLLDAAAHRIDFRREDAHVSVR